MKSKYGLIGVIFFIFCFLLPIQFRTSFDFRLAPVDFITFFLFIITFLTFKLRKYTFSIWHVGLIIIFGIATLNTVISSGNLSIYVILQKDIGLIVLFCMYYACCQFFTSWERIRWFLKYFISSIALHTLIAIIFFFVEQLSGTNFTWMNAFSSRLSGMLIDPNAFGGLLVATFAIHIASFYSSNPIISRPFGYSFSFILIIGIILTFSRSAWLALAIVLIIQAFKNPLDILRIGVTSIISVITILFITGSNYLDEIIQLATRSSQVEARFEIIEDGLKVFYEAPLFGIGLGEVFERFHIIIHNTPVWILIEFGIFGFVVFLMFLAMMLNRGIVAYQFTSITNKPVMFGLLLSYIAMAGLSLGIEALYQRHWWVIMALINSAFMIEINNKIDERRIKHK